MNASGSVTEMNIPKGSTVEVSAATEKLPQKTVITVSEETPLKVVNTTENISGAQSFQGPTPVEIAKGDAVKWYLIAGGLFLVGGLVLAYFQHYKASGFAFVGAFAVPVAGQFLSNDKVVVVAGILGAVAVTLVCAWYLVTHKFDLFPKGKR